MKIFIYNFILLILLPFIVLRTIYKGYKDSDYLKNFKNRFGIYEERPDGDLIWFHAVSLGEVIGSEKVVKEFYNTNKIILTVSTPTGLRHAKKIHKENVIVVYAPWDIYLFIWLFIKKFNPTCLILFETEIWPSMIHNASKNRIPIVLSNARMSASSLKKYLLLKQFTRHVFSKISLVLAQSKKHSDRFKKIGVLEKNLKVVGSAKFDSQPRIESVQHELTQKNLIFLAASTHEGEDEIVIDSYKQLIKKFPSLKLILVPRHPERADLILKIFKNKDTSAKVCSEIPKTLDESDAIIISSIGKLNTLYDMADIAFIGGSLLSKYGGHNIIEPAKNKCAIIIGPHIKNFEDIVSQFIENDACWQLKASNELSYAFKELLNNNELRINMIHNAFEVVTKNRGSAEMQHKYISDLILHETSNSNN